MANVTTFLNNLAASVGLGGYGELGGLLIGVLLLFIIVKALSMPFKLVWNGFLGALLLWLINLFGSFCGFGLEITIPKALIAGFFGVPGVIGIVLFELFG